MSYKYKPSKANIAKWLENKKELEKWVIDTGRKYHIFLRTNEKGNSFYFTKNNIEYRVSTHNLPNHHYIAAGDCKYREYKGLGDIEKKEYVTNSYENIKKKIIEIMEQDDE